MSTLDVMVDSYLTPKLKEGETIDLSLYTPSQRTNIRLYGLDCKDWTPLDVFDYRLKWHNAEPETVKVQPKNLKKATRWCKMNLYHQDFNINKWANAEDSHNFVFKDKENAFLYKLGFSG